MVLLDRRVTIDEVAHVLQISHGSAYEMMHNKLRFIKLCKMGPKTTHGGAETNARGHVPKTFGSLW